MKTMARQIVNPQLGMDLSIPASPNTAQLIENFRYDAQTKGWTTHLGFEPYFHTDPGNGPFTHLGLFNKPVDSLYVFQKHGSKQQNILYECAGRLCLLAPYRDTASTQRIILDQTRTVPTPNAVRTSYEPYGKYCIITNGIDEPVKFRADGRLYPLGWAEAPGDPTVSAVRVPDSSGDITALEATDSYVGSGSNIYQGDDSTFEGVSSSTDTVTVEYIYRVSFVNENGSESPLSNNSNKFVYKGASVTRDGNSGVPKVLAVLSLATGPVGTVARRIYRTQSDGDQSLFYFVEEVKNNRDTSYTDYRSDKSLGAQAPNRSDSIRFPAKSTRFTASFKNCLFVDGGEMDPTRLYFSRPLEPDRFAALDFFEVGTREGGDITGLEAYYNSLLVFRENGIDLIRGDNVQGFEIVPFVEGIGAYSHNAIVAIPNLGVTFISRDGIYLISGGLDGGSDLVLKKLSQGLDEVFERLSIDAMPAAVGAFSPSMQELHYYMPVSGQTNLRLGLVFHTNNGQFTQRVGFPIRCITTDKDGNFLFGCDEYSPASTPGNNVPIRRGIYAISAKRAAGTQGSASADVPKEADPLPFVFRSQWIDMGLPYLKKYPKYLYLYVMTTGDMEVKVDHFIDRNWQEPNDGGTAIMQPPDHIDQPVYDKAKFDQVIWQDKRMTEVRVPITCGACSSYAFEISGIENFIFIGYSVEYQVDGAMTIKGKRSS
tara:strand:- start:642 stop:2774 length:2133 start_codon:yes stop_codon:yes gene_type:complete